MKTAFITGANRGIGFGFVRYLLDQGYKVFTGTRKLENMKLKHENLHPVRIDISDDDSISNAVENVSENTDIIDLLVNNAGMNKDSATNGQKDKVCVLSELDRESLNRMFDVNATSQILVTKAFVKLLKGKPSFVINISSGRASIKDEYPNSSANYGYCASKAALNRLVARSIVDLGDDVKTFAVHPGGVKTDMNPRGTHDAYEQAGRMIDITKNWHEEFNGMFLRFNGMFYPV